jgi:hypothetical protein
VQIVSKHLLVLTTGHFDTLINIFNYMLVASASVEYFREIFNCHFGPSLCPIVGCEVSSLQR